LFNGMHSDDFEAAVEQHQRSVFTFARYLLSNPDDAEEVAQEVFVKLWDKGGVVAPDAMGAWLLRVTRNACYDLLRRRRGKLREVSHSDLGGSLDVADTTPDPEILAASSQLGRRLLGALATLAEPQRSIVILREIEGLSCREIGTIVDMTEGSVRVSLHRARCRLRDQLREVHHGAA
jgi:RNA polymerase sigma-70 factor (ECF subfamily)